jgi:hypothetical protein
MTARLVVAARRCSMATWHSRGLGPRCAEDNEGPMQEFDGRVTSGGAVRNCFLITMHL